MKNDNENENIKIGGAVKKVITVILSILVVVAVGLNVYVMVCTAKGKAAVICGNYVMRVSTGSMQPSIYAGDYIKVKEVPVEELNVGDIISFYSEDKEIYGKINTHRIVELVPDGFVTKGDANPTEDETIVHYDNVIGKYVGKVRYFRWLGSFKSVKKLIFLGVILLTLCISIYEVKTIAQIKSDISAENEKVNAEEREKLLRQAIEEEKLRLRRENFSIEDYIKSENKSDKGDDDA